MKGVEIDTNRATHENTREIQATRYNTVIIKGEVERIEEQPVTIRQTVQDMYQDLHQSEQSVIDRFTAVIEAQNGAFRSLHAQRELFEARLASIESGYARALQIGVHTEVPRALILQMTPAILLSTDRLLLDLSITSHQIVGDIEQVLRQSSRLDPFAMAQAQQLLRQDRFWSWYCQVSLDLIMVHGTFRNEGVLSRMSPLSATCATLVTTILRERPGDITLYFFCGQHTSPRDSLAGPQGMMRCLLARLLVEVRVRSQFDTHLDPNYANAVEGTRQHNMEAMCLVFHLLLLHVPQGTTVFCIIDGVSWLDQPNHVADTLRMIQLLRSLTTDSRLRANFKFMLTGPWPSSSLNPYMRPEEHISLLQGDLMQSRAAGGPLLNRLTLSPSQYQHRLLRNR